MNIVATYIDSVCWNMNSSKCTVCEMIKESVFCETMSVPIATISSAKLVYCEAVKYRSQNFQWHICRKKHILRFLEKKYKGIYHRIEKDDKNWGRIFVHFRW